MSINKNIMSVYMGDTPINLKFNSQDETLSFLDDAGKDVKVLKNPTDSTLLTFDNPKYMGLSMKIEKSLFTISAPNTSYYVGLYDTGFKFLNSASKPVDIINPASFLFFCFLL